MRVTVCELPDSRDDFERAWQRLTRHVREEASELVVLPEMPFYPWFATTRRFDPHVWQAAVAAHDEGEKRLPELAPAAVIGTRPVDFGNYRYNAGFLWTPDTENLVTVHSKAYLPDEEGTWEASWYQAALPEFIPVELRDASVGYLICSELWAMEQARLYGKENVHILVTPRLTSRATLDKWLAGGRVAAVLAGAFGLSSNRVDPSGTYGGQGWVVGPEAEVIALTSAQMPFVTVTLDLAVAQKAKGTYPRNVI